MPHSRHRNFIRMSQSDSIDHIHVESIFDPAIPLMLMPGLAVHSDQLPCRRIPALPQLNFQYPTGSRTGPTARLKSYMLMTVLLLVTDAILALVTALYSDNQPFHWQPEGRPFPELNRTGPEMRGSNKVISFKKRIIFCRFCFKHIQSRPGNMSRLQSRQQCIFINQSAMRNRQSAPLSGFVSAR